VGEGERHPEVADLLAYRWEELPAARRGRIAAHLGRCAQCRRLLWEHERFLETDDCAEDPAERERRQEDWEELCERLRSSSDETD
jgi:hypothetical protein